MVFTAGQNPTKKVFVDFPLANGHTRDKDDPGNDDNHDKDEGNNDDNDNDKDDDNYDAKFARRQPDLATPSSHLSSTHLLVILIIMTMMMPMTVSNTH